MDLGRYEMDRGEKKEKEDRDLFAVETEEWAAHSTGIFFNCTQ